MKTIEQIDRNFAVRACGREDVVFLDCCKTPFRVFGVLQPTESDARFLRMPQEIADRISEGVSALNCNTAGGRVRFCTDSPYIAIRAKLCAINKMPHFALTGSTGFDLYSNCDIEGERYIGTFIPPFSLEESYTSCLTVPGEKCMREFTVNFPLYAGVSSLEIGLQAGAALTEAADYRYEKPVLYYGSSITQGGCASRPGNSYQAMLTRALSCDHINLGFSGSACGEDAMADYIASIPLSAFVYDYDHNAPSADWLKETHERFLRRILEKQPKLPVIVLSRPKLHLNEEEMLRKSIIQNNCKAIRLSHSAPIFFVDGSEIFRNFGDSCTVDNSHPNDLGFYAMAQALLALLQRILQE